MNSRNNRVLLIYNPLAGNNMFASNMDLIIDKFQRGDMQIVPVRLGQRGIIEKTLSQIDVSQYKKIIAAGGDGTFHIVVNAMMKCGVDLPLALFPSGTANDFAYYFDLPHKIDDMIKIALADNYTYADLGQINDRYFINVAALGAIVAVSQKTDPDLKNVMGRMAYYLKGASEIPGIKPVDIHITSREFTGTVATYFMIIMNGRSAGGFRHIAPYAQVNDGLLDVMIFREMPVMDLPQFLLSVAQGTHPENRNVVFFQTNALRVESEADISTDMDGEKGCSLPMEVSLLPRQLKINTLKGNMEGTRW
ncbi:MAG: YegS/Rv2252/BmrU family lipid kinase [Bacillota bacterium]|nr:YegS/Rv2252/BmrU family lipid kinase [Bacillota bacterium]